MPEGCAAIQVLCTTTRCIAHAPFPHLEVLAVCGDGRVVQLLCHQHQQGQGQLVALGALGGQERGGGGVGVGVGDTAGGKLAPERPGGGVRFRAES